MRKKINLRNEQFNQAINNQDGFELSLLYVQNAMLYPPKQARVQGRDAISFFFNSVFKLGVCKGCFTTMELIITGDYAIESGEYVLSTIEEDQLAKGFYMYTWQYIDGEWYILNDIWND